MKTIVGKFKIEISRNVPPYVRPLLLVALGTILSMAVPVRYSAQSTAVLEGAVIESGTDRPLEHVQVTLNPGTNTAYTNAEGQFRFMDVSPGRYRVSPDLQGFVYASPLYLDVVREPGVWVQVTTGAGVKKLQIHMSKAGVINGSAVVIGETDALPASYSVMLLRYRYDDYGNRRLGSVPGIWMLNHSSGSSVKMDDRGRYRFYGLPPGKYLCLRRGRS